MKKFIVLLLSLVLCLSVLSGCGSDTKDLEDRIAALEQDSGNGYDDKALIDRITQLEQDSASLAARLTLAEGKLSSEPVNKIYNIGDEVKITSYGYDLFKIKLVSAENSENNTVFKMSVIVENISMPNIKCIDYINIAYTPLGFNDNFFTFTDDTIIIARGTSEILSVNRAVGTSVSRLTFVFPNANIPYAVFQV